MVRTRGSRRVWRCAGGCDEIQQDRPRSRVSVPLPRLLTHHHYLTHQTLIISTVHIKPSSSPLPYTSNPHHHHLTHQTLIITTTLHIKPSSSPLPYTANPHQHHYLTHQTLISITTLHSKPSSSASLPYTANPHHQHHYLTHQTLIITTTLHIKPSSSAPPYTSNPRHLVRYGAAVVRAGSHQRPCSSSLSHRTFGGCIGLSHRVPAFLDLDQVRARYCWRRRLCVRVRWNVRHVAL